MQNGHLIKEKTEYVLERFKTVEGLIDFFIGTAVWGFIITKYAATLHSLFFNWLSFLGALWLRQYAAYLLFGVFSTILGLIITIMIVRVYDGLRRSK